MTTIFYARVSTADQTLDHQVDQARKAGIPIDEVVSDRGQSGLSTVLAERPEGRRLYDKLRQGDTLVVRWVDRLGRNYQDVTDTIRHFIRTGVTIKTVINSMTFDGTTTDPTQQAVRDALIAFMAATAQAQAEATKEAQRAGIEHAKAKKPEAYRGRKPSYDRQQLNLVRDMTGTGAGTSEVARASGLSRQTVLRIRHDLNEAEAKLFRWGM
ncbi:recombinase family protein [Poseidonocella sedimentorum]|uniref:Site-specific DNA recombinase n=1 Tax=Poseidonocella sedimentorum TaxID=871652 RepID=A0A1I6CMM7_9RHOB|nr:recombinase family protein [Poseidonocella sedimentorum]SFQ94420.1 Site-specific DNA recombinase [Poseidonocella sedimentorum]